MNSNGGKQYTGGYQDLMVLLENDVEVESLGLAEDRLCYICTDPIPLSRLKAMPTTGYCVSCLEACGDVEMLKRHDDYIGRHGDEVVSTYYKGPHQYIDMVVKKLMNNNNGFSSDELDETRPSTIRDLLNHE